MRSRLCLFISLFHIPILVFAQTTIDSATHLVKQSITKQFQNKVTPLQHLDSSAKSSIIGHRKKAKIVQLDSVTKQFQKQLYSTIGSFNQGYGIRVTGGTVVYNYSFRSVTDTPFNELKIAQHTVTSTIGVNFYNILPLRINFLGRYSNSEYFRNISDFQVQYDRTSFQNSIRKRIRDRLSGFYESLKDTFSSNLYDQKVKEFTALRNLLNTQLSLQRLVELKELAQLLPVKTEDSADNSQENAKIDSIRNQAQEFIVQYETNKRKLDSLGVEVDSLKTVVQTNVKKAAALKEKITEAISSPNPVVILRDELRGDKRVRELIPKKYQWLLSIRNMGLGRNQLNYSELTAKNISLNGVNFEYNSWYYVAAAAGVVDFRFREFAFNNKNIHPQHFFMIKGGIGSPETNFLAATYYRGTKNINSTAQLNQRNPSIVVSGISLEGRLKINKQSFLQWELAESMSPALMGDSIKFLTKTDLKTSNNKAYSFKYFSYFPKTQSRVEAFYRYTGAQFQSFSYFRTNTAMRTWYVKADQYFFQRMFKLSIAIRQNDYNNPLIPQVNRSSNIFKSMQVSFRKRKWPSVSVGYAPTSQLIKLDELVYESQFYSLNGSVNYIYKLKEARAITTVLFNRFYNNHTDTGFLYFNSANIFLNHTIEFKRFSTISNFSYSGGTQYKLYVLEGGIRFHTSERYSFLMGWKINNINHLQTKVGFTGSLQLRMGKFGFLNCMYDKGYLPGRGNTLADNDVINVLFTKTL